MDLGTVLAQLRKKKGLNQREFADIIGVSNGAVAMWETNKRQPDLQTLVKIASFYDVSVDYLLSNEDCVYTEEATSSKNTQNIALGERLRQIRSLNNYTMSELSQKLGITIQSLTSYERGNRLPSLDLLIKLADFYGISLDTLVGRDLSEQQFLSWNNVLELYPDAIRATPEIQELIEYYDDLSKKDKRWIMGQMIDLSKKADAEKSLSTKVQTS